MDLIKVPGQPITTKNTAASYTAPYLLTGAPVGTDAAPTDLASVTAARRMSVPEGPGVLLTSGTAIVAYIYDGASTLVGRFWWYDSGTDIWVPNGTSVTLTVGTTNSGSNTVGCMPGSLWFFQVTANAGSATKVWITFR